MADIFISHSSRTPEARETIRRLATQLTSRWTVWWDDTLVGSFPKVIEDELKSARCLVPAWTQAAHDSDAVHDELTLAKRLSKPILPVRLEDCEAPFGFGTYSGVELRNWRGETDHPALLQLLRKLESVVPPTGKPKRQKKILGDRLELPALFMSVSSHETQLTPLPSVQILRIFGAKAVLVSAYDLLPERRTPRMLVELKKLRDAGALVLVDSGNYEASRLADKDWTPLEFERALVGVPHDCAFSFDVLDPSPGMKKAARQIIDTVASNRQYTKAPILPIVHAPYSDRKGYLVDKLPALIREVCGELAPPLVAVPERELGQGLVQRAHTVQLIRRELDTLPFYQPLHLLGTGNPWSIAVLAAAGADSFDGLEWCRVVVDRETSRLHHFQHFDLFAYQLEWAASPLLAQRSESDKGANIEFNAKAALHNLDYFALLGKELRVAAASGDFAAFVKGTIGAAYFRFLERSMPTLFP